MDYVKKMSFAEFRIRLYAYNRQKKEKEYWYREIAWNSLISFNVDFKKLPKNIEQYIPLNGKKKISSDLADLIKDRKAKALEQYKKDLEANG